MKDRIRRSWNRRQQMGKPQAFLRGGGRMDLNWDQLEEDPNQNVSDPPYWDIPHSPNTWVPNLATRIDTTLQKWRDITGIIYISFAEPEPVEPKLFWTWSRSRN